jgi:hypothetical protein
VNSSSSAFRSSGVGNHLGAVDCLRVESPLMDRLPASLARQFRIHLSFGFEEGVFSVPSRVTSRLVRCFYFLNELLDFRINGRVVVLCALARQSLVCDPDFVAPARFGDSVQIIECCVRPVSHFAHPTLLKQPSEDRPIHRFGHQCFGFFDFRKFSHSAKNITIQPTKVQHTGFEAQTPICEST